MAGLTYAQRFSFAETVAEILLQNKEDFIEAGLAAEGKLAQMNEKNSRVKVTDARQEKLKADLKQATETAVAAVNDSYKFASSTLDAMSGAIGKGHPLARRLRQLRDQMVKEAARGKRAKA